MTDDKDSALLADELAGLIDNLYEAALSNSCTCNIDENACRHCGAWGAARRDVNKLLAVALRQLTQRSPFGAFDVQKHTLIVNPNNIFKSVAVNTLRDEIDFTDRCAQDMPRM